MNFDHTGHTEKDNCAGCSSGFWQRPVLSALFVVAIIVSCAACSTSSVAPPRAASPSSKTPVAATTSKPPRGTLLYQSDWSHGLARWPGSAGWKIIGGLLQSNASSNTSLTVPYLPPVPNYAIEVRFQIVSIPHNGGYVVITADKTPGKDGYTAGIMGLLAPGPHSEFANPEVQAYINPIDSMETNPIVSDYEPGSIWHTYRVEVQGPQVQFFIDDLRKSFATSAQTNFLSNGPIQVKVSTAIINLLRVRITAL